MKTELDRLIAGLQQRLQAQATVPFPVTGPFPAWQLLALLGAAGLLILSKIAPDLAQRIQSFAGSSSSGAGSVDYSTVSLSATDAEAIQQAITEANQQVVDEWRAGTQSDYGLSFAPSATAGFETWEQAMAQAAPLGEGRRDAVARMAYQASPNDPCGWLRNQWRDAKSRLSADRLNQLGNAADALLGLGLRDIEAAGKAYCVDGMWRGPTSAKEGYGEFVSELGKDDVFVFGSNESGFHGAGSAGYASFGRSGNIWRAENYGARPNGWQGRWNVKGVGEGLQVGTEGTSYAMPTVTRAGEKLSILPEQMIANIRRMYNAAFANPDKRFLVAGETSGRLLNGYTHEQMAGFYRAAGPIPDNVIFSNSYTGLIGS